jgi:chloramphenicol O-acetyltransferase type A
MQNMSNPKFYFSMYDIIDLSNWKRKDLFNFFSSFDNPTWDLICEMRITAFHSAVKEADTSFFLSVLYAGTAVCNSIEEMGCRIDDQGQVRRYKTVHPGSTLLYDTETYGYGYFTYMRDYRQFIRDAEIELELQKQRRNVDTRDEDLGRVYFSPIPWVSFSGFRHPFRKAGNLSIPMIVFGKHFERDGERYMAIGLTLHHGLADGYHAGLFFCLSYMPELLSAIR